MTDKSRQVHVMFRFYGQENDYKALVRSLADSLAPGVTFLFNNPIEHGFSDYFACSGTYWPFTSNEASAFAALVRFVCSLDPKIKTLQIKTIEHTVQAFA